MYKYGILEFEWDELKEVQNILKHRINFAVAAETFLDPNGFELDDESHSLEETRSYWIGVQNGTSKVITTWFTRRGHIIRIIGAAEWRKFRRLYETTKSKKS